MNRPRLINTLSDFVSNKSDEACHYIIVYSNLNLADIMVEKILTESLCLNPALLTNTQSPPWFTLPGRGKEREEVWEARKKGGGVGEGGRRRVKCGQKSHDKLRRIVSRVPLSSQIGSGVGQVDSENLQSNEQDGSFLLIYRCMFIDEEILVNNSSY